MLYVFGIRKKTNINEKVEPEKNSLFSREKFTPISLYSIKFFA